MTNKEAINILKLMPKQSDAIKKAIEVLEQEPKTGHWINLGISEVYGRHRFTQERTEVVDYKCSNCGRLIHNIEGYLEDGKLLSKCKVTKNYPYCHCGAKMEIEK